MLKVYEMGGGASAFLASLWLNWVTTERASVFSDNISQVMSFPGDSVVIFLPIYPSVYFQIVLVFQPRW